VLKLLLRVASSVVLRFYWREIPLSSIGFWPDERQAVIHRPVEILLASDVALSGLNRSVAKKKLDLLQLPTGSVA
jgi:hypothetical protein